LRKAALSRAITPAIPKISPFDAQEQINYLLCRDPAGVQGGHDGAGAGAGYGAIVDAEFFYRPHEPGVGEEAEITG
jgi:hypothetical protein